jgi:hypothetical protein
MLSTQRSPKLSTIPSLPILLPAVRSEGRITVRVAKKNKAVYESQANQAIVSKTKAENVGIVVDVLDTHKYLDLHE